MDSAAADCFTTRDKVTIRKTGNGGRSAQALAGKHASRSKANPQPIRVLEGSEEYSVEQLLVQFSL
jgi:hypothetical protein